MLALVGIVSSPAGPARPPLGLELQASPLAQLDDLDGLPNASDTLELREESLKKVLSSHSKIFCIGADKTGTTTLKVLFEEMPGAWNPCHGKCPEAWYSTKRKNSVTL